MADTEHSPQLSAHRYLAHVMLDCKTGPELDTRTNALLRGLHGENLDSNVPARYPLKRGAGSCRLSRLMTVNQRRWSAGLNGGLPLIPRKFRGVSLAQGGRQLTGMISFRPALSALIQRAAQCLRITATKSDLLHHRLQSMQGRVDLQALTPPIICSLVMVKFGEVMMVEVTPATDATKGP
ncbi:MAG: hypothetical protein FRX49_02987 [Trebouxia sp. A1-2]|nr:MAG: hypothetical protein FRX49_02987 [Trebouxia sp. A1-2]